MPAAFDDLRVIDLSDRLAGAWCTRLFADFGADVVLIEPAEGHALRREPPFLDDEQGPERSLVHAYVNANKRSQPIPPDSDLAGAFAGADIVVTTAAPLPHAVAAALQALAPGAVHVSVTPFGLAGPLAGAAGNNLTHSAMSGWADICGYEGEPPLQLPPHQSDYIAGVAAFIGAAGALARRDTAAEPTVVDVSELEAVIVSTVPWSLAAVYEGPGGFCARVHEHHRDQPPFHRTKDGLLIPGFGQGPFWMDAMNILGLHELAEDRFADPLQRRSHLEAIRPRIEERLAELPRWEVFEELCTARSVSGVVQDMADLIENPHLAARGYFVQTEAGGRRADMPGAPAKLSATPWALRRPAPELAPPGTATDGALTPAAGSIARQRPRVRESAPPEAPLRGMRVLTFTQAWTGALATELLALLGADVVQIEARSRPDVWRTYTGGYRAAVPERAVDPTRRQRAWNVMGLYNGTNLNKRAITLDMSDPRGAELFWRMVPRFDIFAENFSPHVLTNWGVTYEAVRERRPDIIFASLSGYGADGPYSSYGATGATIEPMSGFSSLHGYPGGTAENSGGLIPDPVGGLYLAAAILAAAHHRRRTGQGQRLEVSMMEAMAAHLGDAVLERSANGRVRGPIGNRHPRIAPHGIFPTADERWIALAAESDEAWRQLAAIIAKPGLATDPLFASAAARKRNEDELEAIIARWCRGQNAAEAAATLQAIGCCAAAVARLAEVLERPHPQLVAREFMRRVTHPEAGTHTLGVAPWRFDGRAAPLERPSPCLGEHSFAVFEAELGMSRADYEALVAAGVTGDMPPDEGDSV